MEGDLDQTLHLVPSLRTDRLPLHHLHKRHDHRTGQTELDPFDDPDLFLVRVSFGTFLMLLNRTSGTFPCLSFTHRTRCISVRPPGRRLIPFGSRSILDGLKGWANVVIRDGWKCTSGTIASPNPSSSQTSRYHTGRLRCRRQLSRGQGLPFHFLSLIVVAESTRHTNTPISCLVCSSMRMSPLLPHHLALLNFIHSWAIPVCMFFSWVYMRPKYHWTQILVSLPNIVF